MTSKEAIENTMDTSHMVLATYLADLNDDDLMVRSVSGVNHIAWQLGHLIASENQMMSEAGFNMPALPDGFAECHTPETANSDDRGKFHGKEQYLVWMEQQRDATKAALKALPDSGLDKPAPEAMRDYAPTIGTVFNLIGLHELMHAGQFVPVRRTLGKPVTI